MEAPLKAREVFYNHYASLTNILGYDVENLLPELIAQRVLTTNDKVTIEKTVSPSEKAGRLLNIISGTLDAGNQASFEKLLLTMANGDNEATRDTAIQIMKEAGITPKIIPKKYPPNVMASPLPKEREVLIKHYAKLTSTVRDVDNLLPHFVTARIINSDDMDEIKAVPRTSERVAKLLKFISGPLDAGFTKSFYKMLDIMYYYGNDSTRELAIAMGRKEEASRSVRSPSGTPTSPTAQDWQRRSSSNSSVYSPTGETPHINPEVVFDEEDGGKGIIDNDVMDDTKKAVCRIRAAQMLGTGFIGYLKVGGGYFTVLVTNHHVIQTVDDAMSSRLKFESAFGKGQHCTVKLCDAIAEGPDNFWTSSVSELDFTIVRLTDAKLKDIDTNQLLDINPIILSKPADIKNKDQIYVIQYPHNGSLSLSASSCYLKGPLLLYKSGTTNGSSGSPVLKEVNGVLVPVALHRGGNSNARLYRGCNFGTLISEILKCLSGQPYSSLPSEQEVQAVLAEHQ